MTVVIFLFVFYIAVPPFWRNGSLSRESIFPFYLLMAIVPYHSPLPRSTEQLRNPRSSPAPVSTIRTFGPTRGLCGPWAPLVHFFLWSSCAHRSFAIYARVGSTRPCGKGAAGTAARYQKRYIAGRALECRSALWPIQAKIVRVRSTGTAYSSIGRAG